MKWIMNFRNPFGGLRRVEHLSSLLKQDPKAFSAETVLMFFATKPHFWLDEGQACGQKSASIKFRLISGETRRDIRQSRNWKINCILIIASRPRSEEFAQSDMSCRMRCETTTHYCGGLLGCHRQKLLNNRNENWLFTQIDFRANQQVTSVCWLSIWRSYFVHWMAGRRKRVGTCFAGNSRLLKWHKRSAKCFHMRNL